MALADIESLLRRFARGELRRPDGPGVTLALRGRWGVGKTFVWKRVVAEAHEDLALARSWSGYVSLFGLDSIDDVRSALVASLVVDRFAGDADVGEREKPSPVRRMAGIVGSAANSFATAAGGGVASALAFEVVRDALVCIDDVERKGDGLSMRDVFGLVTQLREERGCDLVVILNDEQIDAEAEEFAAHGEKAIDYHVRFAPTPREAFEVAFGGWDSDRETARECCERLQVTNVRVLQRVRRTLDALRESVLGDLPAVAVDRAVRSAVLLTWARHASEDSTVPFERVRQSLAVSMYARMKKREERTEEEQAVIELHDRYGHWVDDGIDQQTAHFVETGWFDESALELALNAAREDGERELAMSRLRAAWGLYTGTFEDNEREVVAEMYGAHRELARYVSVPDMDAAIRLLRDLDATEQADALVGAFEEDRQGDASVQSWRDSPFADRHAPQDPAFAACIDRLAATVADDRTLAEVAEALSVRNGWSPEDTEFLASRPVEEYEDYIRSIKGGDWIGLAVRTLLRFGQIAPSDPDYEAIEQRTREALRRIADSTRLNRMRVDRSFDLGPEEEAADE